MAIFVVLLVMTHVLMAEMSLPLIAHRVPPNGTYGFRVPATLANDRVWYAANADSGQWTLAATAVSALFAIVYLSGHRGPFEPVVPLLFLTLALLASLILSFVSLRRIVR